MFTATFRLSHSEYEVHENQRRVTLEIVRYGDLTEANSVCKFFILEK